MSNLLLIDCNIQLKLDISHLIEIKQSLTASNYTGTDWIDLGLHLGLLITTLEAIEAKHKDDMYRCLLECLTKWLQKADNVRVPTWATLASALRQINQKAAADMIIEMSTK